MIIVTSSVVPDYTIFIGDPNILKPSCMGEDKTRGQCCPSCLSAHLSHSRCFVAQLNGTNKQFLQR